MESRDIIAKRIDFFICNLLRTPENDKVTTKIYGSCATGLTLPSSDIDIGVFFFF